MRIQYLGHSCFRLTSASGTAVVTDPYRGVGYEMPKGVFSDIITVSHGHFDHNYISGVEGAFSVVNTAGEFQINDVEIVGVESFHDSMQGVLRGKNCIFTIQMDGIRVCHFGDLGEEVSSEILQKIGNVDVVLLPIGGTYTITAEQAKEYVDALAPIAVIPMHYKPKDGALDIDCAKNFLSLFDEKMIERAEKGEFDFSLSAWKSSGKKLLYMERMREYE
ncbi:MAG: MBL fold metallo-hydrolase [Clostridia bacterium]|nr:MBL fold metallo-hydrolase [Clostridia bacterium]